MKKFSVFTILLGLLLAAAPLTARQKIENQLTVYSSVDPVWVAFLAKKFEEETGTKVAWVREGTGVVLQRLKVEKREPKADVWFGGTFDGHAEAVRLGLIEPFQPASYADLAPRFRDPLGNHASTGVYSSILGFAVNEKLLQKLGKPIPATWDDLTDPTYKGLIAMANPNTSGTAFTILATLVKLKGEEQAFAYFKKLHANIAQYTQAGEAPGLLAGRGEVAIGIIFLHDSIKRRLDGYPLKEIVPQGGTGYEIGGLSLVKNSPNQAAAKKFINWILEPRVQELGPTVGAFQAPANNKTKLNPNVIAFDKVQTIDVGIAWMQNNRERLIQKWDHEVFALAK